jgi:PST family polysaccharide transporter
MGAAQWRVFSALVHATLQFGLGVVLARLLPPADFGLAAMAAVVIALAGLILDVGIGSAVVQRRSLTERHLRVALSLALLFGALLASLVFVSAPLVGSLMRAERLPMILRVESVLFLLAGMGVTSKALLQRRMQFGLIAFVELTSYILAYPGVALGMALSGLGVWSLVGGALTQALVASSLAAGIVRHSWRPLLARQETGQLLGFGSLGALNGAAVQLAFHGDNLVVGRLLGATALGVYGRAFSLMMLPLGYVGNSLFSVMFPALAELRDDPPRFARAYLLSVKLVTLVAAPVMAGMTVAAPFIISVLYGPEWTGAVLPFQIFCLVGVFRVLGSPAGAVTHAAGRLDAELRQQLLYAVWVIVGAGVGAQWGIAGAALGVASGIVFRYVTLGTVTLRISGVGWRKYLFAQAPGAAVAMFVGSIAVLVRWGCDLAAASDLSSLLSLVVACGLALIVGIYFLPPPLRPTELFQRLATAVARFPPPLKRSINWALRSHD